MVKFFLTDEQVATLNAELAKEGFTESVVNDNAPKFVVGQIVELVPHPDSDHLNICQVNVGDKTVQIVAGAPNAAWIENYCGSSGAMMPSGSLIFPGKLRGEDSFGMMCSPRELVCQTHRKSVALSNWMTPQVGEAFDPAKHGRVEKKNWSGGQFFMLVQFFLQ